MGLRYSECGRYLLHEPNDAYPDKEAERRELQEQIEQFLNTGGSIEQLSVSDFGLKWRPMSREQAKKAWKKNLSFGAQRHVPFNTRIKREDS